MSISIGKFVFASVVGLCMVTISSKTYAAKSAPSNTTKITIAFPKNYNKTETSTLYSGFIKSLGSCANVDFVNIAGESVTNRFFLSDILPDSKLLEGMKGGTLQMAQFNTGTVPVVMDTAGGIPFAARGKKASGKFDSYQLNLIVLSKSNYQKPTDLVGKKIAHTSPDSNSGNLAPRAYFPSLGLIPDQGYTVVYSKGHERSIMGTYYGFWDGAAVASDQFERMAAKEEIKLADFRVLWKSTPFPVSAWVLSNRVDAQVRERIRKCTYQYQLPVEASRLLNGSDAFVPIDAEKDFAPVRYVIEKNKEAKK